MSSNTPSEELRDAICEGHIDRISGLIDSGADVNFIDEESGWALVLWAVKNNQPIALKLLLDHGANVNVGDATGNTALHKAAYLGHGECVELLVQYGANLSIENKMHQTALELATIFDKPDMVKLLIPPNT